MFFLFFSLSLSFSHSLSFSGWSLGAGRLPAFTYLPRFLRPEWEDVLCLLSLGRPGGHLWPAWTGQTSCLGVLLAFLCKQRNISLFLSSVFLSTIFFPYLSWNQLPTLFLLWVSLDPAGAGPWKLAIWSLIPLPFLKPAWTSGSSQFTYYWILAWRILSITLLACEMTATVW